MNEVKEMATLKRNDPCLCGSGKKYKKCCLIKLESKPKLSEADQRAFNELLPRLFDYSKEFETELQPVYDRYVQTFEKLPKADAQAFSQLLFHWLIFNHPIFGDKQTILSSYIEKQATPVSKEFSELLHEWNTMEPKLFRVTNAAQNNIVLHDVFKDVLITLEKTPASDNLNSGDRIIGYLYPTPIGQALGNDAVCIPEKLENSFLETWNDMKQSLDSTSSYRNEQTVFSQHFHEVLEVLSLLFVSKKDLKLEDKLNEPSQQVITTLFSHLDWSAVSFSSYVKAKVHWIKFATKQQPRIPKPETFAAALEYWIGKQTDSPANLSQKDLATKYSVSSSTISSKYKVICQ
ncbi:hypothetical protein CR203_12140 [Salipaludibacillus neizhouensis]|uniref:Uncharacterized protein n=1 Tax=Salipaludibacillus neizhouensis TaxID=885475 RepID=A0A3A9K9Z1_9BACI|nr:SEC-C domain-containing protein [Salipaludibacillus neizhouensis]RKL67251.1 hypothetical protein CR203_12140 [Salipaludibacillus neizhouensis]